MSSHLSQGSRTRLALGAAAIAAFGLACTTRAKDEAGDVQPSISTFLIANNPQFKNDPPKSYFAGNPLALAQNSPVYLSANFAQTGGTAMITPGNLAVHSGQVLNLGTMSGAATYTITVTDAAGHRTEKTAVLTLATAPSAAITAPAAVTTGTPALQASVAAGPSYTYDWGITNGTITSAKNLPTITFTAGSAGSMGASNTLQLSCTVKDTATNLSDTKTANVTVNANAPGSLSYGASSLTAYASVPLTPMVPTVTGGDPVQAFAVTPALPAGLSLNAATGVISGTPTGAAASGVYHVTATNSGGSAAFELTLLVDAQPPATFGVATPTIGLGGSTVLSWTVDSSVDSITVDNGVQTTPLSTTSVKSGAYSVSPSATKTYTLTAHLAAGGTFSPAAATVTVDATPFAIGAFTTDAAQNTVLYGAGANLHWTLTGLPAVLTLDGASVIGTLGTTVNPVRRQTFTLYGDNGLSHENTSTKTLTIAAQGLDLLAGHYSGPGYKDASGAAAQFNAPFAVTADAAGNLYVADSNSHVIRMVDTSGTVTTLAGVAGVTGTTDTALGTPLFNTPRGIVVTGDGQTIFVADYNNQTVRKLVKNGSAWTVSTLAGQAGTFGTSDGVGTAAQFDNPCGLCLDSTTTPQYLYVTDSFTGLIRQVELATSTVITYAGNGTRGHVDVSNTFLGSAVFGNPWAIAFGTVGAQKVLFILDTYTNCLRALTYNGAATIKATSAAGMTGSVYSIAGPASGVTSSTSGYFDGTGTAAKFNGPNGLVVDASGTLYIADATNNCIRAVTVPSLGNATGVVTTFAGSTTPGGQDNSAATSAGFKGPQGLTLFGSSLIIADSGNSTFRTVDLSAGTHPTTTVVGAPRVQGYANGLGATAKFFAPTGVAVDAAGNAYVADTSNHVIRKIDAAGNASLLAGNPGVSGATDSASGTPAFKSPQGVAVDKASGVVYVADTGNKSIRMIATNGTVTTLVSAGLSGPSGILVDPTDATKLWVTDSSNKLFPVTISGATGTLGAAVGSGFKFNAFAGITADATGNLYIADVGNNCIRKLTKTSSYAVSTYAGMTSATAPATAYGFVDGALGTNKFNNPQGIDIDASGNLFVTDWRNHAIRKIATDGTVSTLVGKPSTTYNPNGSPSILGVSLGALPAGLINPQSLAVTPTGDLVVVTNDAVLQVTAPNGQ